MSYAISGPPAELSVEISLSTEETRVLLERITLLEAHGNQFDGAEASLELLVRRSQPEYRPPFELEGFMIVERRRHKKNGDESGDMMGEAIGKLKVGGAVQHTAGEGSDPVNALILHSARRSWSSIL